MNRQEIIDILRAHEGELRAMGIERLDLFGSYARNEGRADSDIDLHLRFRPGQVPSYFALASFEERLERLLGHRVDVMTGRLRNPAFKSAVEKDRIHVI